MRSRITYGRISLVVAVSLLVGCRSRLMPSTDTILRGPPLAASPPTATEGGAHWVSPDERSAAIARGPVPGFAGYFLEGCTRVVLLTDTSRQAAAARRYFGNTRGQCAGQPALVVRQVRYDFAQLYDWYMGPFRSLWRVKGATSSDIDEVHNQLAIGVRDSATGAHVQQVLDTLPIPKGVVRIDKGMNVCVGTGGPSVEVEVRDPYGRPAAIGTTIVIQDDTFKDSVDGSRGGELRLGAGERRPGTYEVRLYKPWYKPVILHEVRAPGDTLCRYATPSDIRKVTLELMPNAPPIRSVTVLGSDMSFGLPDLTATLRAVIDAEPGVSNAVLWSSSDTTVATVSPDGGVRSKCRTTAGTTTITATSVVDRRVQGHAMVSVSPPVSRAPCRQ